MDAPSEPYAATVRLALPPQAGADALAVWQARIDAAARLPTQAATVLGALPAVALDPEDVLVLRWVGVHAVSPTDAAGQILGFLSAFGTPEPHNGFTLEAEREDDV